VQVEQALFREPDVDRRELGASVDRRHQDVADLAADDRPGDPVRLVRGLGFDGDPWIIEVKSVIPPTSVPGMLGAETR